MKYNKSNKKQGEQKQLDNLIKLFWNNAPYILNPTLYNELEVRFGTKPTNKDFKSLNKNDFDNVIGKLKSLNFVCQNEEGNYMLRIQNEVIDSNTGKFRISNIRTEINGFENIQEYCKTNDIQKLLNENSNKHIVFNRKSLFIHNGEKLAPVDYDDFHFRVTYSSEDILNINQSSVKNIIHHWQKSKKTFRFINRVTFSHPDLPFNVDMSIVKKSYNLHYTTLDANLFGSNESFEIELELDNTRIGPGTNFNNETSLITCLKKSIKYVLMGLQETNFPVSYDELNLTIHEYMNLIHNDDEKQNQRKIYPSDFIGPSSYTLQIQNIAPINENSNIPNIRKNYTVTDKADGQRNLLFISSTGKIYLINTNMKILFTGAKINKPEYFDSLLDGEIITHDKYGKYINLYAAFDIYFINKKDIRSYGFDMRKETDKPIDFRLPILKNFIKTLEPISILSGSGSEKIISPIRIESKNFYPTSSFVETDNNIFNACRIILEKEKDQQFEYNTDGLIFTPASMGVGTDDIGKPSLNHKSTWEYSFKWKPSQFNTIDFLVTTLKNENSIEIVTPIFQDGLNTLNATQFNEYKTIILRCGFDQKKHGYLNPCQDVLDDKYSKINNINLDNDESYQPVQFYPTNPSDDNAGICNIMLKKDDTGLNQMITEEGEVFFDNIIVEFRYEISNLEKWRWIPLRVRYDKTHELRQGLKNYGNAYHVANSNWHSIHNPITEEMLATGNNIPNELADDDVYYNRIISSTKTRALRDFHNLFVKKMLIMSVSKKDDILIDYACGKAGDLPKWIQAKLDFILGIDLSKDNLENKLDGACARYLNYKKKFKHLPAALFLNGNSSLNIRSGDAMLNDKAVQIIKAVFGSIPKNENKMDKAVLAQYGKSENGFQISSCQFSLHYFFENQNTLQNFVRNLAECTKIGGYFIGACYDGKLVFNLLKNKVKGDSVDLFDKDDKIWEIRKEYSNDTFEDDVSSLGYKINVYQESINKMMPEYLVNFDYLNRVMENYGFSVITREEAHNLGLPEGSGLFIDLYNDMMNMISKNKNIKNEYGLADKMNSNEKKISFLNRYFVYKKIIHVNAEKIELDSLDESIIEEKREQKKEKEPKKIKSKVIKLNKKLVLQEDKAEPEAEPESEPEIEPEREAEKEKIIKEKKTKPITLKKKSEKEVKEKTTKPKLKIIS
jgi:hypothetical protein